MGHQSRRTIIFLYSGDSARVRRRVVRRSAATYGSALGFLVALVVASVAPGLGELSLALIVAVWAVGDGIAGQRAVLVSLALGAFSGLELVNKLSIGIGVAALTGVMVLSFLS